MQELVWNPSFAVGIPQVDEEHRQLISIFNDLHRAVFAGVTGQGLYLLCFQLTTCAEAHFKNEETLMIAHGYGGLGPHRQRHVQLLRQVGELTLQFGEDLTVLSCKVLDFLGAWLLDHILDEDLAFGRWLRAHGG